MYTVLGMFCGCLCLLARQFPIWNVNWTKCHFCGLTAFSIVILMNLHTATVEWWWPWQYKFLIFYRTVLHALLFKFLWTGRTQAVWSLFIPTLPHTFLNPLAHCFSTDTFLTLVSLGCYFGAQVCLQKSGQSVVKGQSDGFGTSQASPKGLGDKDRWSLSQPNKGGKTLQLLIDGLSVAHI